MKKNALGGLVLLCLLPSVLYAQAGTPRTITAGSLAMRGEPKYKDGFSHFDYVNPQAPKGGNVTRYAIGTYDNFHRYALRGTCAAGHEDFYDTLMTGSNDEADALYPLIAQSVEYAEDYSFIIFTIDPRARDQEGEPITAEDVAYSFNLFFTQGVPQFRAYYAGIKVEALPGNRVRFDLPEPGDKERMMSLGGTTIFPRRFWRDRDFAEPLMVPPLGTGAYRVKDYKMGQYVVLERVKDYWAADLPVKKGQNNFDTIRYDYYRDDTIALEAFKSGEYDIRGEQDIGKWTTQYTGGAFSSGELIKEEIPHEIPQPMNAYVFNIQRPLFQDVRIRRAINYFFDFEWMNKSLFYGAYTRTRSFFQNTIYAARGLPAAEEIAVLEPLREQIPPEVFTREYQPPVTDASGFIRPQMREALALFNEAGWELKNGRLTNRASGERMSFELLIYNPSSEKIAIPLQRNLERFGILMRIRMVDTSQFVNRMRSRDFDLLDQGYSANYYPSGDLKIIWHSQYIDSTYNFAGVIDSAVDYLVEGIAARQEDEAALLAWGRALDRVLTWNHYVIPRWHTSEFRVAYHKKFAKPPVRPRYIIGINTWWIRDSGI